MDQLESVVLAGGSGARVDRAVVIEAHAVTTAVIEALGVLESHRGGATHARAPQEPDLPDAEPHGA